MILHLLLPYDLKLFVEKQNDKKWLLRKLLFTTSWIIIKKPKVYSLVVFLLLLSISSYSQTPVDTISSTDQVISDTISNINLSADHIVEDAQEGGTIVEGYVRDEKTS